MHPQPQKPKFTAREVADEVFRLTGHQYDPGYISNVRCGARIVKSLEPVVAKAEANLEARAQAA